MDIRIRASVLVKKPHRLVRYNVELPEKRRAFAKSMIPWGFIFAGIWILVLMIFMSLVPESRSSLIFFPDLNLQEDSAAFRVIKFVMPMIAGSLSGAGGFMLVTGTFDTYSKYYRRVPQGKIINMELGFFQSPYVTLYGYTRANKLREYTVVINRKWWDSLNEGDFVKLTGA